MPQQTSVTTFPERDGGAPRCFALFCTLFLLAAVWLEPQLEPLNRLTADLSGTTLALGGFPAQVSGELISLAGFQVRIVSECTSLYATLLLAAFILACPATWRQRLAGIVAGGLVIGSFNLLRIVTVTVIGSRDQIRFEIIHVYLGQVLMLLLVLGCCLAWRRWCAGERGGFSFLFRAVCWATILFPPWLMVHKIYLAGVDALVRWFFALLQPQYAFTTPQPLLIYNHAFSLPLFVALLLATTGCSGRRRIIGGVVGILALVLGHALFRTTHVIWTAYGVAAIEPLHQIVYLLGQFLLPVLLWLLVTGRFRGSAVKKIQLTNAKGSCFGLLLCLLFSWPALAQASSSLVIQPSGDGVFQLRAYGLKGMTGGEFTVGYHSEGDDLPRVNGIGLGAGAALQIDTGSSGSITIRLTSPRPLRGTGLLASIQLNGGITYLSASLQNEKGGSEHPATRVDGYPEGMKKREKKSTSDRNKAKSKEGTAADTYPVEVNGTESGLTTVTVPSAHSDSAETVVSAQSPGAVVLRRLPSTLERLLAHDGERTPEVLQWLFRELAPEDFRQEPPLLLADGQAELRVSIRPTVAGDEVRCFLIRGAHFISLQASDSGEWLLNLVPERGGMVASVTVQTLRTLVEYPLTIAPPLSLFTPAGDRDEDRIIAEFVTIANDLAQQTFSKQLGALP